MLALLELRWQGLILDTAIKALILAAAAGAVALALRRASAASRHLVWLVFFSSLLALPPLAAGLPGWQLPIPGLTLPAGGGWLSESGPVRQWPAEAQLSSAPVRERSAVRGVRVSDGAAAATDPERSASSALRFWRSAEERSVVMQDAASPLPGRPAVGSVASTPLSSWWRERVGAGGMFLLWLLGVAGVVVRSLLALVQLARIGRRCRPVTAAPVTQLAARLGQELDLRRPVTLLYGFSGGPPAMPMTWGFRRPVVLLPTGFAGWPEARQRAVLLHELAHVRRGDWLSQRLGQLVAALYWFLPPVWWALSRLRAESEQACDDRVLLAGVKASDYAADLLGVIHTLRRPGGSCRAAVAMARRPRVEARLSAILDARRRREAVPRGATALAVTALVGVLLPVASARVSPRSSPASGVHLPALAAPQWPVQRIMRPVDTVSIVEQHVRRTAQPAATWAAFPAGPAAPQSPDLAVPPVDADPVACPQASSQAAAIPAAAATHRLAGSVSPASAPAPAAEPHPDTVPHPAALPTGLILAAEESPDADAAKDRADSRKGAGQGEPDLSARDLSGADLHGRDLSGRDLSGKDLSGANLSGARLRGCNLSKADLSGANLAHADLSRARAAGADFSGATLDGINLAGADLSGSDLSGINLSRANTRDLTLAHADLSGSALHGIDLGGRDLSGTDFSGSDLSGARLSGADLTKADLSSANLGNADLSHARLRNADLSGANLNGTRLDGADLAGADVSGTRLDRSASD